MTAVAVFTLLVTAFVLVGLAMFIALGFPEWNASEWPLTRQLRKLSPLLIGLVWMTYGILHLAMPAEAVKQIPPWFPYRYEMSAASGAAEIALGLLSISAPWRKLAFFGQLVLLIVLTPFVVFMLSDDAAMTPMAGGLPLSVARLVLVFHNLLLFFWIHWAYTQAPMFSGDDPAQGSYRFPEWIRSPTALVAGVMLLANLAGFTTIAGAPFYPSLGYLWAMGSLCTGALIGFVFGVPKVVSTRRHGEGARYLPNTNIEKISDWLTAVVIGVSLVQLHAIGGVVDRMSDVFAKGTAVRPGMASSMDPHAFASGIIVYFFAAGLIQGYLLTRMFLTWAFQSAQSADSVRPM